MVCCGLLVISVKSVVKLWGQNFGVCLTEESATPTTGPEILFSPVPGSQNGADAISGLCANIVSRPAVLVSHCSTVRCGHLCSLSAELSRRFPFLGFWNSYISSTFKFVIRIIIKDVLSDTLPVNLTTCDSEHVAIFRYQLKFKTFMNRNSSISKFV